MLKNFVRILGPVTRRACERDVRHGRHYGIQDRASGIVWTISA